MAVRGHGSNPRGGKADQGSRALLLADSAASTAVEGRQQSATAAV